jgi:hypothetical protein
MAARLSDRKNAIGAVTLMRRGEGPLTTRLSRSLLLLARSLKEANPVDGPHVRKA